MNFSPSERRTLWLITAFAGILRLVFLLISMNAGGDGPARTFVAVDWAQHPVVVTPGHWMPLQIYLSGMALWLWDNLWLAPRFVSLLFGIGSLWPFARLCRSYFSWEVTVASSLLFSMYGLHVSYSGVSSSEALFMFLALWGMTHFVEWWQQPQLRRLVWSGLFWLPATWTRNEAWWLAAASGLLLVGRLVWRMSRREITLAQALPSVLVFGTLVSIGPLAWLTACWISKGDPLWTYTRVHASFVYSVQHGAKPRPLWYRTAFWPLGLSLSLGPHVLLLSLIGLVTGLRRHLGGLFFAFILAYGLPFWMMQVFGAGGVNVRHTMFIGTLLLPFTPYALEQCVGRWRGKLPALCGVAAAAWLLIIFGLGETRRGEISQKFVSISPRLQDRWHVTEVAAWIRAHSRPTDRIAIDEYNDESSNLQFYTHLPPDHVRIYWSPKQSLSATLDPVPRYLVCAYNGPLGKVLNLDFNSTTQQREGLTLQRRYTNSVYAVFEITPQL